MWMCRPSDLLGRIACIQSDGGLAPPGYRDVFCQRSEMTRLEILAAQQGAVGIEGPPPGRASCSRNADVPNSVTNASRSVGMSWAAARFATLLRS